MPDTAVGATRPVIAFQPERHRRLLAGHPWAYSNELALTAEAKALEPGSLITLATASGEPIGTAMFNPRPLISARLITREVGVPLDRAFFAARLERALALRQLLFDAPFYRLVHAEADGLPGLVIDRFGDVVVAQLNSAGMERLRDPLLGACDDVLAPRALVLRNDAPARATEGLPADVAVVRGALAEPVELIENACRFRADLIAGQKTGWFYDQRDNRAAVAQLARGRRVLDVFAYTGGFGVLAAARGAAEVVLADRSKPALALALESAALNDAAACCRTLEGEAFPTLERLAAAHESFDIVIADPPAFVKSRKDLAVGIRAYRKLVRLAAALVRPGGFLFVASCSHNVTAEAFGAQVCGGLSRARRSGRIVRAAGAAADHPVHPFLPESAYLKALLLQLD
jgi:23S rRNA (cytosine1962-C5)-methyltransferase